MAAVLAITLMMAPTASAVTAEGDENTTVNVTVTSQVAVDVHPDSLVYSSASVGTQTTSSDGGFSAVEIENTGSEYIDRIWVNATTPSSDPFGTGLPGDHDAANFLQIRPNSAEAKLSGDDDFTYVNRMEFMEEETGAPSYLDLSGAIGGSDPSQIHVGRFRAADEEFFYVIPTDANSVCDGSASDGFTLLRVANTSHTSDRLGTYDFGDNVESGSPDYTDYTISELSNSPYGISGSGPNDGEPGVTLTLSSGANRTYDVLTLCDTDKAGYGGPNKANTVRSRYAVDYGNASDLTNGGQAMQFLLNAGVTTSQMLFPGESVTVDTAIEVPRGVSQGDMNQGILTVLVTANETAQQ